MKRRETSDEREAQLDAWDRRLEERQRELDAAILEYRSDVKQETARLLEREEQLLLRAKELRAREDAVAEREAAVLDALERLNARMDQCRSVLSKCTVLEGDALDPQQTAAAQRDEDASPQRSPPPPVPAIKGLKGMSGAAALANDTCSPARSSQQRGTVSKKGKSASPAHIDPTYEGPVDPTVESHVEVLPSDGSSSTPTPRGIRASPQFKAMDPNDSGLFFFRGGHRRESFRELRGADAKLQDQFDLAIEYLLGNGLLTEEQVEDILNQSNPEAVIELYQEYLDQNAAAAAQFQMGEDEDGEVYLEEEELEEGDEDAPPQFYHRQDESDNAAATEEDEEGDPRRRRHRELHDDDQEEIDEDESRFHQYENEGGEGDEQPADPAVEGTPPPAAAPAAKKHVFDDFDDDE